MIPHASHHTPAALRHGIEHQLVSVERGSTQEERLLAQWKDSMVQEIKDHPAHKRSLLKLLDTHKADPTSPLQMTAVDAAWEISKAAALMKGFQRKYEAGPGKAVKRAVSHLRGQVKRNSFPQNTP